MSFSDILNSIGQSMSGGNNQGSGGLTGNWVSPTGSGLSAYNPQGASPMGPGAMPLHSPGLLQSILGEQEQPHPSVGLHELLMRLGLFGQQPHQAQPQQ